MSNRIATTALGTLALTACATAAPPQHGVTPGYSCSNEGLEQFVGRAATQGVGAEMLRVSGARTLRWVRPGMAVTMEFRQDRLTVHIDESGRIERASCG